MVRLLARRRVAIGIVAVSALGAALGLAVWPAVSPASASPDDAQIRGVVVRAAHALQEQSGMPPASYLGGPMSQALRDQITEGAMAAAHDIFRGAALSNFAGTVRDNLDEQASGVIRHLAAGVSQVDITSLQIDGDRATVKATLDVWAEFGQVHGPDDMGVARPDSQTENIFLLERIDGTWYVTGHSARWAGGNSGP